MGGVIDFYDNVPLQQEEVRNMHRNIPGRVPLSIVLMSFIVMTGAMIDAGEFRPVKDTPPIYDSQTPELKGPNKNVPASEVSPAPKGEATSMILTIKLAFKADPRLFPYNLEVDVQEKLVELGGKVSSENEKQVADHIAQVVTGGKTITNNIEIDQELAMSLAQREDEMITRSILEQFMKSQTLREANFEVTTNHGIVSLSGSTRFQVILLEAAQAAQQVPGVKAVRADHVRLQLTK